MNPNGQPRINGKLGPLDPDVRFQRKVEPCPTTGCWLWMGGVAGGYGTFWIDPLNVRAHRWAYERWVGPIPTGLQIDHLCRTPLCVNPAHLEVVTSKENTLRGESPAAKAARLNVCKRGHDLSGAMVEKEKRRVCRECRRINRAERFARTGRPK